MPWSSPELNAALAVPLDPMGLNEAALEGLVSRGVREGEQLDFKERLPRTARASWLPEQEFVKDVAALANYRGGLLLYGIKDEDGIAVEVGGLDPSPTFEQEEQRLRQVLLNYGAPLPAVNFFPIPLASGCFCLAVVVPPSQAAPHAVLGERGDSRRPLRYPRRHGADTTWMTEFDVAEAYARRLGGLALAAEKRSAIVGAGCDSLLQGEGLWVYVAAIPDFLLPSTLNRTAVEDVLGWYHRDIGSGPLQLLSRLDLALPAPGRVTLTERGSRDDHIQGVPRGGYAELHLSGASFAAAPSQQRTADELQGFGERTLANDVIALTDLCLRWCTRQVGAWGTATVVIGIVDSGATSSTQLSVPIALLDNPYERMQQTRNTRRLLQPPSSETVVDLAAVGDRQGRLAASYLLLSALVQWFGLAESEFVRADGTLVSSRWGTYQRTVERWAADHGVSSTER